MQKDPDTIELIHPLQLSSDFLTEVAMPYLRDLYKDLTSKSGKALKGVSLSTFLSFANLPGLIGERFFAVFDKDRDGFWNEKEFLEGTEKVLSQIFEQNAKVVFDMYDFDQDGFISREDIRILLSHVPILDSWKDSHDLDKYFERIQSQEELEELLEYSLKGYEKLDFDKFVHITETVSCEMFLCIFLLIRKQFPLYKQLILYSQKIACRPISKPATTSKKMPSPKILTRFSPISSMTKYTRTSKSELSSPSRDSFTTKVPLEEHKIPQFCVSSSTACSEENNEVDMDVVRVPYTTKIASPGLKKRQSQHSAMRPPGLLLRKAQSDNGGGMENFCECGEVCGIGKMLCEKCQKEKLAVYHDGYLYKKCKSEKLKKCWYKLLNKELYIYKAKEDTAYYKMKSLLQAYVKEDPEEIVTSEKRVLYPFTIFLTNRQIKLYAEIKFEQKDWVASLKEALGYSNIEDFYEIKKKIGKGRTSVVRIGINKKTHQEVAVKIINKYQIDSLELEQVRREIEILKLCQHPNIVKILDLFENNEFIYIVQEFLHGGDLFSYLDARDFRISEARACQILHSLACALSYLHRYGIAHRDFKPENVLMTDESDNSVPKIADFGLAKMTGPSEKCTDTFGTLSYVAPEVLNLQPYDKSVDVWSLGVVSYLLLCGSLPFDSDDDREIVRQTLHDEPDFRHKGWRKVSEQAKAFVAGILVKDKKKRMTLEEILEHPWIVENQQKISMELINRSRLFSMQLPLGTPL